MPMNKLQTPLMKCLLTVLLYLGWLQAGAQVTVGSGTVDQGYTLNSGTIYVDPNLQVASLTPINGFKVTISSGFQSGDLLSFTDPLPPGINDSWDGNTGVLTFTGSAAAEDWQNLLRSVTFRNNNSLEIGDRTITFSAGNLSAFTNGHFYELVDNGGDDWYTAKANAETRTYLGMTGYLATVATQAENDFIAQVLAADAWIGATDEYSLINAATGSSTYIDQWDAEGRWYWVTGPEAGTLFSTENAFPITEPGQYANWNDWEPNDSGGEHFGQIYSSGAYGRWNDLPDWVPLAFVVEYGGMPGDPSISISATTRIYMNVTDNAVSNAHTVCYNASASDLNGSTPGGGNGNYSYQWIRSTNGAAGTYTAAPGTNSNEDYTPGTLTQSSWYRRVVTSGSAVDTSSAIQVTVNPAISVTPASTSVACNGGSTGTASVTVSGGTSPYAYAWSNGGTSATVNGMTAGSYTCTVTDAANCTTVANFTITQPTALTALTSQTNVSCHGTSTGSATVAPVGGTSPYSYQWAVIGSATASVSNLAIGTYTCTVTDANSCTTTRSITITQPAAIAVSSASLQHASCNGSSDGSVLLTATGGTGALTYAWTTGASGNNPTGLSAGTYTCTIQDANNCTSQFDYTITEPAAMSINSSTTDVSCHNGADGQASVTVAGGVAPYSFTWNNGGSASGINGLPAGNYTVTITDDNGCTSTRQFTIAEPSAIQAMVSATAATCYGSASGEAHVTVSGGVAPYTYDWSNGGTTTAISNIASGTYDVTVTDANACTVTEQVSVGSAPQIVATTSFTALNCPGDGSGTAEVQANGGTGVLTYLWSDGSTAAATSGLQAGNYTVVVSDANQCSQSFAVTVTEPAALAAGIQTTDAACGQANGSASASVAGGTGPYLYDWSTGASGQFATGFAAGSYSVEITDANGCQTTAAFVVNNEDAPTVAAIAHGPSCSGGSDGTIDMQIWTSSGNYTLLWDDGFTGTTLTGLPAGVYGYKVIDANGCTTIGSVAVNEPLPVSVTASVNDATGTGNGSIDLTVDGGTPGYTFQWSNGATTEDLSNLLPYDYTVTVTDANGCSTTQLFTVGTTTGISGRPATSASFQVFPNPSNGTFQVLQQHAAVYQLLDATGRLVRELDLRGTMSATVTLDSPAPGVYFLRALRADEPQPVRIVVN
jgi:hypothetical protein